MFNHIKKRKKIFSGLAVMGLAGVLATALLLKGHVLQADSVAPEIPLVRTMMVGAGEASQQHVYPGEVRGRYESRLAFQVGGKIISRQVELGSQVRRGQRLMQIDPKDIEQLVNSQSAQVASAKSQLQLAEQNLKRYRQLFEQDVISRAQLDRYQSAYDVAEAGYRQANALQAQSANQLSYSSLYADRAGVVSEISAEAGQVVGPGQPVMTLVQDGAREIEIAVPENRLGALKKDCRIKATFWALPNLAVEGKIREIAPMADAVARTYRVRVSLVKQPSEIKLGMTASVSITAAAEPFATTCIPLSSVYQTRQTPCVWVVDNGTVRLQAVRIGAFGDGAVQILTGLRPGDTIVTAGVHMLRHGQKVKPIGGDAR